MYSEEGIQLEKYWKIFVMTVFAFLIKNKKKETVKQSAVNF